MKYFLLFVLVLLSFMGGNIWAQGYEVSLHLDVFDPRDLSSDLHPLADYERRPSGGLLEYLVRKHHAGEIALYTSKDLSKKIALDSLEYYAKVPAYEKLDSSFQFSYYEGQSAYYDIDFSHVWGYLLDNVREKDTLTENWEEDGFGGFMGFGEEPIDSQNTPIHIFYMTGWELYFLYEEYDLFLYENWMVHGESIEAKQRYLKMSLIDGEVPGDYFIDSVTLSNIFIAPEDFDKIPIDLIFRKKWGAIQEETLGMAFKNRNFPCKIFSIRNREELLYKYYKVNRIKKSEFLEDIKYAEYVSQQRDKKEHLKTESISPFILSIDKNIEEAIREHELYNTKYDTINHSFFEGELFQDLIQHCIDGKIPIYGLQPWERESMVVYNDLKLYFFSHENYGSESDCVIINDAQRDTFLHNNFWHCERKKDERENSNLAFEYEHADTVSYRDLPLIDPRDFIESISVEGTLYKKENQIRFLPEWLFIPYKGKKSFRIKIEDLLSPNFSYDGKKLYNYLTSLEYFSYPVYVNNPIIRNYSEAIYLRELLFNARWEEIHQEKIDPASCSVPPQIGRFY